MEEQREVLGLHHKHACLCVCVYAFEVKVINIACILYTHNCAHTIRRYIDVKQNWINWLPRKTGCYVFPLIGGKFWPTTYVFISLDSWINWPSHITCPVFIQHYVFTRGPLTKGQAEILPARSCARHIALRAMRVTESQTTILQDWTEIVFTDDWWSFMSEFNKTFI